MDKKYINFSERISSNNKGKQVHEDGHHALKSIRSQNRI